MTRHFSIFGFAALICGFFSCEASDPSTDHHPNDEDSNGDNDSDSDSDSLTEGGADADADADADSEFDTEGPDDGCSEESKKIYALDQDRSLFSYNPPTREFDLIGVLDCPGGGMPYSMSVSREGIAYVLFANEGVGQWNCLGIYEVDVKTGTCGKKTPFVCRTDKFNVFGMGFSTDGPNTIAEKLYIARSDGDFRLASLDAQTGKLSSIGPLLDGAEMTGNAKGELWAYFAWTKIPTVAQIDKGTGALIDPIELPELSGFGPDVAFAFAHWGGDYFLFHGPGGENTKVFRLHEGVLEEYQSTKYSIVRAGVSTCAPIVY